MGNGVFYDDSPKCHTPYLWNLENPLSQLNKGSCEPESTSNNFKPGTHSGSSSWRFSGLSFTRGTAVSTRLFRHFLMSCPLSQPRTELYISALESASKFKYSDDKLYKDTCTLGSIILKKLRNKRMFNPFCHWFSKRKPSWLIHKWSNSWFALMGSPMVNYLEITNVPQYANK